MRTDDTTTDDTTTTTTTTTAGVPTGAPTVVLVDPTSPDGESSLSMIGADVDHVSVVVLISGRHSSALRDFARAEQVDLVTAGWYYLDQVAERIARPGLTTETVVATGPDTGAELAVVAIERRADRIVLPASVARLDRRLAERLRRDVTARVDVAELVGVA